MSNPFDDLETDDVETESGSTAESTGDTEPGSESTSETGSDESSASTPASSSPNGESPRSSSPNAETADDADEDDVDTPDESVSPAETGPAFEYSEVKQKPFYARTETVNEFENHIRTTIVPRLAEAEVLDEETREIHDAVLRLANERPERVAELVLEERRQSGNQ